MTPHCVLDWSIAGSGAWDWVGEKGVSIAGSHTQSLCATGASAQDLSLARSSTRGWASAQGLSATRSGVWGWADM